MESLRCFESCVAAPCSLYLTDLTIVQRNQETATASSGGFQDMSCCSLAAGSHSPDPVLSMHSLRLCASELCAYSAHLFALLSFSAPMGLKVPSAPLCVLSH